MHRRRRPPRELRRQHGVKRERLYVCAEHDEIHRGRCTPADLPATSSWFMDWWLQP